MRLKFLDLPGHKLTVEQRYTSSKLTAPIDLFALQTLLTLARDFPST